MQKPGRTEVYGINQLLVYADVNILCENLYTTDKLNRIHE